MSELFNARNAKYYTKTALIDLYQFTTRDTVEQQSLVINPFIANTTEWLSSDEVEVLLSWMGNPVLSGLTAKYLMIYLTEARKTYQQDLMVKVISRICQDMKVLLWVEVLAGYKYPFHDLSPTFSHSIFSTVPTAIKIVTSPWNVPAHSYATAGKLFREFLLRENVRPHWPEFLLADDITQSIEQDCKPVFLDYYLSLAKLKAVSG